MCRNGLRAVLLVFIATIGLDVRPGRGADPALITPIQVRDMCCNGCARKIAAKLSEVRGVTTVQCDVKKKIVSVTPQQGVALPPLALWEAIEKAPDQPIR